MVCIVKSMTGDDFSCHWSERSARCDVGPVHPIKFAEVPSSFLTKIITSYLTVWNKRKDAYWPVTVRRRSNWTSQNALKDTWRRLEYEEMNAWIMLLGLWAHLNDGGGSPARLLGVELRHVSHAGQCAQSVHLAHGHGNGGRSQAGRDQGMWHHHER